MPDRVSQMILLCEDDPHANLVRRFLEVCGLPTKEPYLLPKIASRQVHGGNDVWVLREFPRELHACRQRQQRAETLLIVVIDADMRTVDARRKQLLDASQVAESDPLTMLIPKRHVETWIRSALGERVNETDSYKHPPPTRDETRTAADNIHAWARAGTNSDPPCVPSLRQALSAWRVIG